MQAEQRYLVLQGDIALLEKRKRGLLDFIERTNKQILELRGEVSKLTTQKQELYKRIRLLLVTVDKLERLEAQTKTSLQQPKTP